MTTAEALAFLQANQPFPYDSEFIQELADSLKAAIAHIRQNPDDRFVRPLVFCMGWGGGLDLFDQVEQLIYSYPPEVLVPVLGDAILAANDGTQFRALGLAADFADRRLLALAREKMNSPFPHVRDMATAALCRMVAPEDRLWVEQELSATEDGGIADNYREVLADLPGGKEQASGPASAQGGTGNRDHRKPGHPTFREQR